MATNSGLLVPQVDLLYQELTKRGWDEFMVKEWFESGDVTLSELGKLVEALLSVLTTQQWLELLKPEELTDLRSTRVSNLMAPDKFFQTVTVQECHDLTKAIRAYVLIESVKNRLGTLINKSKS